jgi:hypothetical protein
MRHDDLVFGIFRAWLTILDLAENPECYNLMLGAYFIILGLSMYIIWQ